MSLLNYKLWESTHYSNISEQDEQDDCVETKKLSQELPDNMIKIEDPELDELISYVKGKMSQLKSRDEEVSNPLITVKGFASADDATNILPEGIEKAQHKYGDLDVTTWVRSESDEGYKDLGDEGNKFLAFARGRVMGKQLENALGEEGFRIKVITPEPEDWKSHKGIDITIDWCSKMELSLKNHANEVNRFNYQMHTYGEYTHRSYHTHNTQSGTNVSNFIKAIAGSDLNVKGDRYVIAKHFITTAHNTPEKIADGKFIDVEIDFITVVQQDIKRAKVQASKITHKNKTAGDTEVMKYGDARWNELVQLMTKGRLSWNNKVIVNTAPKKAPKPGNKSVSSI